eukprot:COSAG01_NODE_2842_length_6990_cov_10.019301_6_plen_92_part_00
MKFNIRAGARDPRARRVGSVQAATDTICLHALAYSSFAPPYWSYVDPVPPDWAEPLLGADATGIYAELQQLREQAIQAGVRERSNGLTEAS